MINQANIIEYINYLYKQKYNTDAPVQLIQGWQALDDITIEQQLHNLYQQWHWTQTQQLLSQQQFVQQQQNASATASNTFTPPQPVSVPKAPPKAASTIIAPSTGRGVIGNVVKLISIIAIGCILGYMLYIYSQYKQVHAIYTLTDKVAVRNEQGQEVGSLDLMPNNSPMSFAQLYALDNEIYNRTIDASGKLYEHRKVCIQLPSLWQFITSNYQPHYVSARFVVDSKEEFDLYKKIFGQLNSIDNKKLQLKHRKIIANCLKQADATAQYLMSSCSNTRKQLSGVIVQELITNNKYQIIAQLSDGYYYQFVGDVVSEVYHKPQRIGYVQQPSNDADCLSGGLLFKYNARANNYDLYSCNGVPLKYNTVINERKEILYFEQTYTPPPPSDNIIEQIGDGVKEIFDSIGENLQDVIPSLIIK
jgi:hypothetical protein